MTEPALREIDRIGEELDAVRRRVVADLGVADAEYIRKVVAAQRLCEVSGRVLLFAGWFPPAWLGGVAALAVSKILDNMEIGHNVMHGQYDWMKDPALNSRTFEWDMVCPGDQWRRSHNFMHHTYTNILDKDRDVGYGILRISEDQRWHPYYLGNPLYAAAQAVFFEYGIMLHDLEVDRIVQGRRTWADVRPLVAPMLRKTARQAAKDYVVFPVLTGPLAPLTLTANAGANLIRNLWAFAVIFCGHFPDGTEVFTERESEDESRGKWYLRQMLGSANITGSPLFHLLSGNLSHQIEHHLFPDLPSRRYPQIAAEVREICERHHLPYNTGSLSHQLGSVFRKIFRLALPRARGDLAR
ncbi:fatty acid desaturase family protein [Amycolatopsis sp. NPDC101161]|uniref:fatty acid desaturase family protein n=1 Tax=Amycolatopsis sp. NPDC101161 TaxID=3363940 RepID=UPI0038194B87